MNLKLVDDFIECDKVFGPMPDFNSTFEAYFIEKAYNLLFDYSSSNNNTKYISLSNETANYDLKWMHQVELAKSSREQNLEIIYNNNRVFFKTVRTIYKHEILAAFPSKDLEISLGLQFVPIHHSDEKYSCKKCLLDLDSQYGLMLHSRYFCSQSANNLIKSISSLIDHKKHQQQQQQQHHQTTNKRKLQSQQIEEIESKKSRTEVDFRNALVYQNYIRLFQHQQNLQQPQAMISQQQRLREQLTNQLLAYFEANANQMAVSTPAISPPAQQQQANSMSLFYEPTLAASAAAAAAVAMTAGSTATTTSPIPSASVSPVNLSSPQQHHHHHITAAPQFRGASLAELNQLISSQAIQNWCAKCNTYFRLTSDLVHHMRTYHRRDNSRGSSTSDSTLKTIDPTANRFTKGDKILKTVGKEGSIQHLKCDICNEVFKEKHHLSRHMTSHR